MVNSMIDGYRYSSPPEYECATCEQIWDCPDSARICCTEYESIDEFRAVEYDPMQEWYND